jgi:four helix bundle protein
MNSHSPSALGLALESRPLPHEKLDVFQVAIELVEHVAKLKPRRGCSSGFEQLRRAASSTALNIAEACGKNGRDRERFFEIARGSALESAAALRVLEALGAVSSTERAAGRQLCERLYAMLTRLCRAGR